MITRLVAATPTPPRWAPVEGMFGLTPDGLVGLTHTVGGPRTPPAMRVGTARCASAVAADGSDLAADGTATARYDLTVLVAEPTRRAVGLHRLHAEHAAAADAALFVLGNKTSDGGDAAWLTEQIGDALLGCVGHSAWVRAAERGTAGSVSGFEPGNAVALAAVRSAWTPAPGNCSRVARCRATLLRWSVPTRRAGGRSSCGPRSAPRWPR